MEASAATAITVVKLRQLGLRWLAMKPAKKALPRTPERGFSRRAANFMARNWENVLEGISDGIIVCDRRFTVLFLNHAAQELTGLSAATLIGRSVDEAFAANPWLGDLVRNVGARRISRCLGATQLVGRGGQSYHVSPCASIFFDSTGAVAGIVVRLNDMGHMERLVENDAFGLQAARLRTMAAGLAHELRNPLGGIRGAAQLLREKLAEDPKLREYPTLIVREVDRVARLLDRLAQPGTPPHAPTERVNIHRIVDEVLMLEGERAGDQVSIVRRFDPSLPEVLADEAALKQVTLNLVKNAIEAMNGEGLLTVTTRLETGYCIREPSGGSARFLLLEIADSGPGMSADCLSQVFTPFFTTKGSGSGLGLTICQRIVAEHGGYIRIESAPGSGTRVCVGLPVAS